jgi:hypothetical protein
MDHLAKKLARVNAVLAARLRCFETHPSICYLVQNQVLLVAKKTLADISDVARHLHHPSIVRVRRDAGDMHRSEGNVDEEQDVIGDESLERTHFDAQEIGRRQAFPVSFDER